MRELRHNSCRTWLIRLLAFLWLLPVWFSFAWAAESVYVLPIEGDIDDGMLCILRRAFREIDELKPAVVVVELNTPGGSIDITRKIVSLIREIKANKIPVYAFVNSDALSAGSFISISCNAIYMASNGIIGSALPIIQGRGGDYQELSGDIGEKVMSAVRSMVRSLAQENGYREDVVMAMVDPNHEDVKIGETLICAKGKILNLTAKEATVVYEGEEKPVLAAGIVNSVPELCQAIGKPGDLNIVRFEKKASDRLALWITRFGALFLGLGLMFVFIEIKTPGFGVFGIAGIALLCVYCFGHYVAGLASVVEIVMIFIGLILIALEVFVVPGFGITGISGITLTVLGVVMAVVPSLPRVPALPGLENSLWSDILQPAIVHLGTAIFVIVGSFWLLHSLLKRTKAYNTIFSQAKLDNNEGYVGVNVEENNSLIGCVGTALSVLRPAGMVLINGKRVDVVTSGDFIPEGTTVKVIAVNGASVIVEKV